ncbi:MAG: hypothetical protein QOH25_935 [Acidobacteriota bacterium]|jgi:hypothetical protein|nr:hypothetical protein [Acidobacteriota bacterium]
MSNPSRLAVSTFASAVVTVIAYMLPSTPLLYFFAPGFWLGDALPDSIVNTLGGYLFPVFASAVIWTLLIFGVWRLVTESGRTNS